MRAFALLLVVLEYLIVSVAIDARDLRAGLGVDAAAALGMLGPLLVCIASAIALISGRRILEIVRADEGKAGRIAPARWFVHGLAFAAFLALSVTLARGGVPASARVGLSLVWTSLAFAVVASWGRLAIPESVVTWAGTEGRGAVVRSVVAGVVLASSGHLAALAWPVLAKVTALVAALALTLVPGRLIVDPRGPRIGLDEFVVEIAPVCSGVEGIGLMVALVAIYLVVFRRDLRFPRALALLPLAMLAAFLANAIRIAALVYVGARISPTLAIGAFHSKAGWVAFCAIGIGMLAASQRFVRVDAGPRTALVNGPVADYLVPELVLLATSLVTGLFAQGFDRLYGARVVTTGLVLFRSRTSFAKAPLTMRGLSGAIVAGAAAFVAWRACGGGPSENGALAAHLVSAAGIERSMHFAFRIVGSVIVVPIAEELAFRGFLARAISSGSFDDVDATRLGGKAVVLSSIVFAVLHSNVLGAFAAGLTYAMVYRWRGDLRDAVVAHATTNSLVALEAIAFGPGGSF